MSRIYSVVGILDVEVVFNLTYTDRVAAEVKLQYLTEDFPEVKFHLITSIANPPDITYEHQHEKLHRMIERKMGHAESAYFGE